MAIRCGMWIFTPRAHLFKCDDYHSGVVLGSRAPDLASSGRPMSRKFRLRRHVILTPPARASMLSRSARQALRSLPVAAR